MRTMRDTTAQIIDAIPFLALTVVGSFHALVSATTPNHMAAATQQVLAKTTAALSNRAKSDAPSAAPAAGPVEISSRVSTYLSLMCYVVVRRLYTRTTRPMDERVPAVLADIGINWLVSVAVAVAGVLLYHLTVGRARYLRAAAPPSDSTMTAVSAAASVVERGRARRRAHVVAFRTAIESVLVWVWFILVAFVVLACLPLEYWTSYLHGMVLGYSAHEAVFVYRGAVYLCSGAAQSPRQRMFVWVMAFPRAVMASCLVAAVFLGAEGTTFGSERGVVTRDPASGAVYVEFKVESSFYMEVVHSQGNLKWEWTKTAITAVCVCSSYYYFFMFQSLGGMGDEQGSDFTGSSSSSSSSNGISSGSMVQSPRPSLSVDLEMPVSRRAELLRAPTHRRTPSPVSLPFMPHGLTHTEDGWAMELKAALLDPRTREYYGLTPLQENGVLPEYLTDMMIAQLAIVAQGDLTEALRRTRLLDAVRANYAIGSVTHDESLAWLEANMDGHALACRPDSRGHTILAFDMSRLRPGALQTDADWTLWLTAAHALMLAAVVNFDEARRGQVLVAQFRDFQWCNFSLAERNAVRALAEDTFPLRWKKIVAVDAGPLFVRFMEQFMHLAPRRILQLVRQAGAEELLADGSRGAPRMKQEDKTGIFGARADLHPALGGTYDVPLRAWVVERLAQRAACEKITTVKFDPNAFQLFPSELPYSCGPLS